MVAVFLSGRPLWVNREINASDAFVAAWLPGSEGGGVADVLLRDGQGKVAHDFSGKLSYSWPRSAAQTPLNAGQGGEPQFAYGYGLKYGEDGDLAPLSEDPGLDLSAVQSARFFERGALAKGWRLRVSHARRARLFHRCCAKRRTRASPSPRSTTRPRKTPGDTTGWRTVLQASRWWLPMRSTSAARPMATCCC